MILLRQATAVKVHIGPLVDAADGFTAETAVAFTANELDLYKAGAAAAADISARTVAHVAGGVYALDLVAGDTDTLGPLIVVARDAAHRPWRLEAVVIGANPYDSLCGGDRLWVDAREIDGSGDAATNLQSGAIAIKRFTVGSGSTTTRVATDLTETANQHFTGRTVVFLTGTLALQAQTVIGYNGATKEITVAGFSTAPTLGDTALIV